MNSRPSKWVWAIALAIAAHAEASAQARYRRIEEPQWLKLDVSGANTGVYAEGVFQETSVSDGESTTYNRFFFGPSFGLNLDGSIYHPYFLRFAVSADGSYGRAEQNVESSGGKSHREDFQYIGRFQGRADILSNKPLNGGIFGSYGRSYREYDFFNRATVDSSGYGARLSYGKPWLSLNANYSHHEEDLFDTTVPSSTSEDIVTFEARNMRSRGNSSFNYTFNQYHVSGEGSLGDGRNHTLSISDDERYGSRDQIQFNSNASYSRRDASSDSSDQIIANTSLGIDHRANLKSSYDLDFDRFQTADGFSSETYAGQAQLQHQLYESLTSTLLGFASDFETADDSSSGYARRFGGGLTEAYTKRLTENHRVRISNSILVEHIDQQGISTIKNERHTFPLPPAGQSFFLNLPNIDEPSIVVTDTSETRRYIEGIDYEVFVSGTRTEIQRITGGGIPEGATVIADYSATPSAQGSYETFGEFFQIRFDLWKNLLGIYNRTSFSLNNAPPELHAQQTASYIFGADLNWRAFRAGAEYEIYDSDQSDYRSARLFQSYSFRPDDSSSLGVDLSQAFTEYVDANRREQNYRFITRYNRSVNSRLRFGVDAGTDFRRGEGVDQTLATLRSSLDYVIGKTTVRAEYNYEYSFFLNSEERNKHLFTLRIRRVF